MKGSRRSGFTAENNEIDEEAFNSMTREILKVPL